MFESMKDDARKEIEKYNLSDEELKPLDNLYKYAKYNGCSDSFENSIKEIRTDSNYFIKFMKRELVREKFGSDFALAKLMVTKFNPNTIAAFGPCMCVTRKEIVEKTEKELDKLAVERRKNREFFVKYFLNDCDLSKGSIVKPTRIVDAGFMTRKEAEVFMEKRNDKVNENASHNDYTRGDSIVIETR